jgi:hypothetical protein
LALSRSLIHAVNAAMRLFTLLAVFTLSTSGTVVDPAPTCTAWGVAVTVAVTVVTVDDGMVFDTVIA